MRVTVCVCATSVLDGRGRGVGGVGWRGVGDGVWAWTAPRSGGAAKRPANRKIPCTRNPSANHSRLVVTRVHRLGIGTGGECAKTESSSASDTRCAVWARDGQHAGPRQWWTNTPCSHQSPLSVSRSGSKAPPPTVLTARAFSAARLRRVAPSGGGQSRTNKCASTLAVQMLFQMSIFRFRIKKLQISIIELRLAGALGLSEGARALIGGVGPGGRSIGCDSRPDLVCYGPGRLRSAAAARARATGGTLSSTFKKYPGVRSSMAVQ